MTTDPIALLAEATRHMPLGVLDSYRFWGDESVFVQSLKGGGFTTTDGRDFVDYRLGYGPIILGYRDARVDGAVIDAIQNIGTVCGFSTPLDAEVVRRIKKMCPNIDKMRFANSGTEAVMGAVRVARGFTGRDRILVVEGGFHGLYDEMMWRSDEEGWPFGGGLPTPARQPRLHRAQRHRRAARALRPAPGGGGVLEPIMGNNGSISATPEYMRSCGRPARAGAMLIVDEVKTGFRSPRGRPGVLRRARRPRQGHGQRLPGGGLWGARGGHGRHLLRPGG